MRWRPSRNSLLLTMAMIGLLACSKAPELTREHAVDLIRASPAFGEPMDSGIVFVDSTFRPGPNTKREIIGLEGWVVKENGPGGLSGKTITTAFTWRWNEGPFAGRTLRSKAKLVSTGGPWKVYDDLLRTELQHAERGEE